MIIIKHYFIIISLLLNITATLTAPQAITLKLDDHKQLSQDVTKLIELISISNEPTRSEIHQELSKLLIITLDKNNKQPMSEILALINNQLQILNKNNKLTDNLELQNLFKKVSQLNTDTRKNLIATLLPQIQYDLYDKEIFEALHFLIKNKNRQGILDASFWLEADTKYHFLRILNRLLPQNLKLKTIQTIIERISSKQ